MKIRMAIKGRENRKLINKIKKTKSFRIKIVDWQVNTEVEHHCHQGTVY